MASSSSTSSLSIVGHINSKHVSSSVMSTTQISASASAEQLQQGQQEQQQIAPATTSSSSATLVPQQQAQQVAAAVAGKRSRNSSATTSDNNVIDAEMMDGSKIDFIGSSESVKDLFTLPYTSCDRLVSLAVHNMGGTLLLDIDDGLVPDSLSSPSSTKKSTAYTSSGESRPQSQQQTKLGSSKDQKTAAAGKTGHRDASLLPLITDETATSFTSTASCGNDDGGDDDDDDDGSASGRITTTSLVALTGLEQQQALSIVNSIIQHPTASTIETATNAVPLMPVSNTTEVNHHLSLFEGQQEHVNQTSDNTHKTSGKHGRHQSIHTLVANVPSADEYTYQFVPPLSTPREYVAWKFRDMNLLVGSKTLIYRYPQQQQHQSQEQTTTNLSSSATSTSNTANTGTAVTAIALRVEEASRLRSLLQQHQEMVKTGMFVPDHQLVLRQPASAATTTKQQSKSKLSYAEALANNLPIAATDNSQDGRQSNSASGVQPNSDQKRSKGSSYVAPDLDKVQLQTCIVPAPSEPLGGHFVISSPRNFLNASSVSSRSSGTQNPTNTNGMSPVSTVLDTYLDNIMANVPQLALCLREKGFIQSVKLLNTEDIPSAMMQPRTFDTSVPIERIHRRSSTTSSSPHAPSSAAQTPTSADSATSSSSTMEQIFSPQIMEMNASALLRFLKTNCTKDNATYLLRREVGHTNVQLFDVSSISAQRQRKWMWWLAMMSYRFGSRLRHLSLSPTTKDRALRRHFRNRQRGLLQNTLDLLESLADMNDGKAHESLMAAIHENLADTFLQSADDDVDNSSTASSSNNSCDQLPSDCNIPPSSPLPTPATAAAIQQPYANMSADALNKAQNQLVEGIRRLWPVLDGYIAARTKHRRQKVDLTKQSSDSVCSTEPEMSDDEDDECEKEDLSQVLPVATQLFGMHHKLVNVSLRLAEIHLKNYWSSEAMQALRMAARRIADSLYLLQLLSVVEHEDQDDQQQQHQEEEKNAKDIRIPSWLQSVQLQYTWLWEHCGHFARSFAADKLWRDRGHASGDDVVSVMHDVEGAFLDRKYADADLNCRGRLINIERFSQFNNTITTNSNDMINLHSLSGVVNFSPTFNKKDICLMVDTKNGPEIQAAELVLKAKHFLQREQRKVLVAACIAYARAIDSFCELPATCSTSSEEESVRAAAFLGLLHQRLGDACNETGKIMLNELRNLLTTDSVTSGNNSTARTLLAAEPLLASALFWFHQGLKAFEECGDLRNLSLLRCNICQCYKLRANSVFSSDTPSSSSTAVASHAEICLQEAANHLQAAHEALGERDVDPMTWDMVSTELAATFLVLGVRRRQSLIGSGNLPVILHALRLSPGRERSIVDPMEQALSIYVQSGNHHQAAASHYQLALFYSKIWTCQRDETKTRQKLSAAFEHYNAAHAFFSNSVRGNEPTFCLLCMDLASLYSAVSSEEDCLSKALQRCLDTIDAFAPEAVEHMRRSPQVQGESEWLSKMDTLAASVEDRVFKLLRNLVKLQEENANKHYKSQNINRISVNFKELYREGLRAKMAAPATLQDPSTGDENIDAILSRISQLHHVLKAIASSFQVGHLR